MEIEFDVSDVKSVVTHLNNTSFAVSLDLQLVSLNVWSGASTACMSRACSTHAGQRE